MGFSIGKEYTGSYFKAQDLPQPRQLVIEDIHQVTLEGDTKLAVQFVGEQTQLVLNKTNAVTISQLYGDNTDSWKGKPIEIYATQTNFGGRMVPCIRVRQPQQMPWDGGQQQQPAQPQQPAPAPPIDA